jgi:hypothetical protein
MDEYSKSAAITAVGNIAGNVVSGIGSKYQQKRQHKYNMQLAEYNYNKNLELWNKSWEREIAYNDPSAQMQRLQNAGINPHMAYAKGGVSNTASSGTLPQYSQESLQVAPGIGQRLGDKLGEIVGTVQQVANLSLTKQAVRKAEAEADLAKLTTERQAAMWKSEKGEYSEYSNVYPQIVNGKVVETYANTVWTSKSN